MVSEVGSKEAILFKPSEKDSGKTDCTTNPGKQNLVTRLQANS